MLNLLLKVHNQLKQQQITAQILQHHQTFQADAAAKAWIVARESGGNYNARNGQYVGAYQLSASYLGGDYSPAHQDEVANQYVTSRYGSWVNAQKHWQECGWY